MDYQQTETIELRKVKPESDVVFQCGRNTLERKTINREQNACMFEPWHKHIERLMGYFLERYNYIKPFSVATDGIKLRE